MAWINFDEISKAVQFKDVLNHINVPYKETAKELKTDTIVVSKDKNIFFYKGDEKKGGSVIQFYSDIKQLNARDAAKELSDLFIAAPPEPSVLPNYKIKHHQFLDDCEIPEALAAEYGVGYVGSRGIIAGKIGFKVYDYMGNHVAWVGKELKKEGFFYPKGFKAGDHVFNIHRVETPHAILCISPLEAMVFIAKGFPYAVGLYSKSLSERQLELLKRFKKVCIFHEEGEAIAGRLAQQCLVRLIKKNSVLSMAREDILKLF